MPDKSIEQTDGSDVNEKTSAAKTSDQKQAVGSNHKSNWVAWLVLGCVAVALIIAGLAIWLIHGVRTNELARPRFAQQTFTARFDTTAPRYFYSYSTSTSGPTTSTTTTTYTETRGVVTAVNSGNIVVAGSGKTVTIATNSSTTYDNGTKPAVNDSVVVVGTSDSSGNITATEIAVTN